MHRAFACLSSCDRPGQLAAAGSLGSCLLLASPGLANSRLKGGADAVLRKRLNAQGVA
jgi:hypothetical protein